MRRGVVLTMCAIAAFLADDAQAQWCRFRGPNGTGVGAASAYPSDVSPATATKWKAEIPFGQSSPVVSDGRVYVTASDGDRLVTLSFDADTGRQVWRREISRAHTHKI